LQEAPEVFLLLAGRKALFFVSLRLARRSLVTSNWLSKAIMP
jgi:hypothetical protein